MWRSSVRDAAHRAYLAISRSTLKNVNDKTLLQEANVDLLADDTKRFIERFQQYGLTTVPLPEKDEKDEHPAEALVVFLGGNRSHAIVLAIDDRRYRLKSLKDGEVALYDDQGQQIHIHRGGVTVSAPKGKKITTQIMADEKRPTDGQQGQQTAQQGSQQQGEQYGQAAQQGRKAYATFSIDKDSFVMRHPTKIVHQIGDEGSEPKTIITMTGDGVELKGDSISNEVKKRFETVGKTFLGLDKKNEDAPLGEIGDTPYKQTYVKLLG